MPGKAWESLHTCNLYLCHRYRCVVISLLSSSLRDWEILHAWRLLALLGGHHIAFLVHQISLVADAHCLGALDAQTRHLLQDELLRIWREYRKTVVFVTHSIEEAIYLSDRIVVMTARPGRVKQIVVVPESRPRDMASADMNQRQREVRAVLNEEIARAAALEEADLMAGA